MNRKEFGHLIQALRRECLDENLNSLTQEELAEKTGLSVRTIIRLENGDEAVKLRGNDLQKLADALQLTTGERGEFFLAASGIENNKMALDQYQPLNILNDFIQLLNTVYSPAFIMDSYFDILAANSSILLLYGLNQGNLAEIAAHSDKFNTLRFYFSPEFSNQQEMMGANWEDIVRFNIMDFRTSSLRYRGTSYFSELLSELRGYPLFKKYWREVYWREQDHIINGGNMSLDSPLWGKLKCIASNYTALTIHGYLILCIYTPISPETFEAFSKIIKQVGTEVYRLGDWPKAT